MKNTVRLIALLMVLSFALTAIACGGGNTETTDGADTTTSAPAADATTTAPVAETENPYDENGYLKSDLPEDLNFNGETVTVLYWEDVEHVEFEAEEITGDIVKDAI